MIDIEINQITLSPKQLVLDPNNPRLVATPRDRKDPAAAFDLREETLQRMLGRDGKDPHGIDQICSSIKFNGWMSLDKIFVKVIDSTDQYLVLEGNRRVTAILKLLKEGGLSSKVAKSLKALEVMEVIHEGTDLEMKEKIDFLLGLRHHGALQKWSAFAQAKNTYKAYMKQLDGENFIWSEDIGAKVGEALSIPKARVKRSLQVFRGMEQIDESPTMATTSNSMKETYYSLCEALLPKNGSTKDYIFHDPLSFLLTDDSIDKVLELCHFDKPNREGAPVNNIQEWRYFDKILGEDDIEKREEMITAITEPDEDGNKQKPSTIWAEREVELMKLNWAAWLNNMDTQIAYPGQDVDAGDSEQVELIDSLYELLTDLKTHIEG